MASQRIPITTTASTSAALFQSVVNQLAEGRSRLSRLRDYAERASDGGADVAAFAAEFGVPTGQAQEAYNLILGAAAALAAAGDFDNLIDRTAAQ